MNKYFLYKVLDKPVILPSLQPLPLICHERRKGSVELTVSAEFWLIVQVGAYPKLFASVKYQ